ncbi:unnamed protein product [Coregonus sp. 'balchen']|nr:unnamed protein product [Coregonus sp. 'balchen']
MLIWHEQSNRYNTELWHFKKQTAEFIKGINQDHGTLRQDLEWTEVWVDRVEREMDYVETQNPARTCVNQADRMVDVDQEVKERVKERKKGGEEEDGYSRVSALVLTNGQYYYQGLMDYLENRFLAIEVRDTLLTNHFTLHNYP